MRSRKVLGSWTAVGLGLLIVGLGEARAQVAGSGAAGGSGSGAGASNVTNSPYSSPLGFNPNPYISPNTNPYMNPFINPYMMNGSTTAGRDTMGLYLLGAVQNGNGIGSGKLGGPKATLPGRASARGKAVTQAEEPENVANVPGGGASRYFGRSISPTTNASRYYNRKVKR
jgi:hypothetical protein